MFLLPQISSHRKHGVSAIFICQQILLKIPKIKFHEIGFMMLKITFGSIKYFQ